MNRSTTNTLVALVLTACVTPLALGQESRPDTKPAAPPTLDELLGIEPESNGDSKDGTAAPERAAEKEADEELQRRLNAEEIGDAFDIALQKMTVAADQLDQQFDTGLGTQRLQEDVLARLEFLLEAAKNQPSGSGSSSSSPQPSPSPPPPEPGKQPSSPKPGDQQNDGENKGEADPPPGESPRDLNTVLDESRSEWGNLPQRVREVLLQGRSEKFSSLYEQLTREYYRRLAEDGSS